MLKQSLMESWKNLLKQKKIYKYGLLRQNNKKIFADRACLG